MSEFELPAIRPPSESNSLLIRVTRNCPWNRCTFCYGTLYDRQKFELRSIDEIKKDILELKNFSEFIIQMAKNNEFGDRIGDVARANGVFWINNDGIKTAFLGDSNSLIVQTDTLVEILTFLYETFPDLDRVTSYSRAKTVLRKSPDELQKLKNAGLSRLHIGLETGDNELLAEIDKGATADEMVLAGKRVVESGISLSEYVVLGLGGKDKWQQHATETAKVLNSINPNFIRLRTLMIKPNTPLYEKYIKGEFHLSSCEDILIEERTLIEHLNVQSELVSDHISNYLRVDGKLPEEKQRMLELIDRVLSMAPELRAKTVQPEALRSI